MPDEARNSRLSSHIASEKKALRKRADFALDRYSVYSKPFRKSLQFNNVLSSIKSAHAARVLDLTVVEVPVIRPKKEPREWT